MLLLALDTATPALTVALHDGSRVLAAQTTVSTRKHGELLAAMIEQVLAAGGAAYGLALAWAGVRGAAITAEQKLPELTQIAIQSAL